MFCNFVECTNWSGSYRDVPRYNDRICSLRFWPLKRNCRCKEFQHGSNIIGNKDSIFFLFIHKNSLEYPQHMFLWVLNKVFLNITNYSSRLEIVAITLVFSLLLLLFVCLLFFVLSNVCIKRVNCVHLHVQIHSFNETLIIICFIRFTAETASTMLDPWTILRLCIGGNFTGGAIKNQNRKSSPTRHHWMIEDKWSGSYRTKC